MKTIIKNTSIVNEGKIIEGDLLIEDDIITQTGGILNSPGRIAEIDGEGKFLMPGIIDDQVHFREPGLTHKADLFTESRACVAGGVTSFMDMPNVNPPSLTQQLLEQRYQLAAQKSLANYSFYMGVSNDNAEEVLLTDPEQVCGIKIFMGSSTGNMLVDDHKTLEYIFKNAPVLIATHCEDEATILRNIELAKEQYGENIPVSMHPVIRNENACFLSSSFAVDLAKKLNTRLHVLHISTAQEIPLFTSDLPLSQKQITAEVCVHHLFFDEDDYINLGSKIKWNPAVKNKRHKPELLKALLDGTLDVVATDHAPHTLQEKANQYLTCPGGAPMVQHSLLIMLDFYHKGLITLPQIAEKMSHNVATCFRVKNRGFIRGGYFADLFLADINQHQKITKESLLYKCGWSPLEGYTFNGSIEKTWVNGNLVYENGLCIEGSSGKRLTFDRPKN